MPKTKTENISKKREKPAAVPEKRTIAEWTIMVYMAGDNNLSEDCVNALVDMKRVDTLNTVHVVAQFDPSDTRVPTRRVVINLKDKPYPGRDRIPQRTPSLVARDRVFIHEGRVKFNARNQGLTPKLYDRPGLETNTADPKTLFDFISWTRDNYKAERYMLILCGHSAGIEDGFLLKDEDPAEAMDIRGLKKVLTAVKEKLNLKLDILGMDSCLMSMVEICFELRGLAEILVSSQSMTPNPGWPYAEIIKTIKRSNGQIEARELSGEIVKQYVKSYVEGAVNCGLSTDASALVVDKSTEVAKEVRRLGEALRGALESRDLVLRDRVHNGLILAHWNAQSYNGELFVDLYDLCKLLEDQLSAKTDANDEQLEVIGEILDSCKNVKYAVNEMVVATSFCGADYQYSYGASIYFPWATLFAYYQWLTFAKKSGANWFSFLESYLQQTRREPRSDERPQTSSSEPSPSLLETHRDRRRVQPYNHGPAGTAHSMRNPPMTWRQNGIKTGKTQKQKQKVIRPVEVEPERLSRSAAAASGSRDTELRS